MFVHIIEARDLRGKDSNNLSDPYVVVSCHGQSQRTEITRDQVNVLWDRMFVFQDVILNKDEFERENIHVQVFDANVIMRNELIGQFSFGFQKVWSQPKPTEHQYYRKWVILTDPEDAFEQMGYLLCSVTVLGPGDKPPTHIEGELPEAEVLRPPPGIGTHRRGYNMMVKIYRGEEVPAVDGGAGTSDPFVSFKFNGIVMRTQPEAATNAPEWNTLLMFPVFTPCLSDNIDMQLWAYMPRSPDVLMATHRIKFSDLLANQMYPTWVNMYRLPYAERSGYITTGGEGNLDEYSSYCGRVQVAISTNITDDPIMEERACRPVPVPATAQYELHCDVFEASGLSKFVSGWGSSELFIEVVWGNQRVRTTAAMPPEVGEDGESKETEAQDRLQFAAEGENWEFAEDANSSKSPLGVCQLKTIRAQLPRLLETDVQLKWDQLPDIILNVYSGSTRIGFLRYDAQTVFKKSNIGDGSEVWVSKPEWAPIRGLAKDGRVRSIGFLLFHMSLGWVKRGRDAHREQIYESPLKADSFRKFYVRAHIYQARNIRAANENGLSSTYVQCSIAGKKLKLLVPTYKADKDDDEYEQGGGGGAELTTRRRTECGSRSMTVPRWWRIV